MRNLLTALAAVVIVGGAGAAYVMTRDISPDKKETSSSTAMVLNETGGTSGAAQPSQSAPTQTAQAGGLLAVGPHDHIIGSATAPVTIVEYASYTCPHCASFHLKTLPLLKSDFIDKGQVQVVFREFVRNRVDIAAAQLAGCAPPESYFNLVDVLFRNQDSWAFVQDPVDALKQIGRTAGLDPGKMEQCIADDATANRLIENTLAANRDLKIESTPTIFVNGTMYPNVPYEDYDDGGEKKPGLASAIRSLLPQP